MTQRATNTTRSDVVVRRALWMLVALNILLAAAWLPSSAAALRLDRSVLQNCCKVEEASGEAFCCRDCCLLIGSECDIDGDCGNS